MNVSFKVFFMVILSMIFIGCSFDNIKNNNTTIKKEAKYKYCNKDKRAMNYAVDYVMNEFEVGYFHKKDIVGAKAQLFLIENNSSSIFAQNINKAQKTFNEHYDLAKKNGCNLNSINTLSPIERIKSRIKILEDKAKK